MNDIGGTENKGLMITGSVLAIVLGWVLNSLISSIQQQREFTTDLIDRVSVMEIRVERLEAVQTRVQRRVLEGEKGS